MLGHTFSLSAGLAFLEGRERGSDPCLPLAPDSLGALLGPHTVFLLQAFLIHISLWGHQSYRISTCPSDLIFDYVYIFGMIYIYVY